MALSLRKKQSLFVKLIALLIQYAYAQGYELTFGMAQRTVIEATRLGLSKSLHTKQLAIDFNLFKNGRYLRTTLAHKKLGEFWESLSTDEYECCWGGRFGDGNHYSIKHGGVK